MRSHLRFATRVEVTGSLLYVHFTLRLRLQIGAKCRNKFDLTLDMGRAKNKNNNKRKNITMEHQSPESKATKHYGSQSPLQGAHEGSGTLAGLDAATMNASTPPPPPLPPPPPPLPPAEMDPPPILPLPRDGGRSGMEGSEGDSTFDWSNLQPPIFPPGLLAALIECFKRPEVVDTFKNALNIEELSASLINITDLLEKQKQCITEQSQKISLLETQLKNSKDENETLKGQVNELAQYTRRNSLRIYNSKWIETPGEHTDDMVMRLAWELGAELNMDDIDRSHRVGRPIAGKPRPILVKFVSYRPRQNLFQAGINLKKDKNRPSHFKGIFINEDLTRENNQVYSHARSLVSQKKLHGAITRDGRILVKRFSGSTYTETKTITQLDTLAESQPHNYNEVVTSENGTTMRHLTDVQQRLHNIASGNNAPPLSATAPEFAPANVSSSSTETQNNSSLLLRPPETSTPNADS